MNAPPATSARASWTGRHTVALVIILAAIVVAGLALAPVHAFPGHSR